jgi:hypothetical protein
MNKKIKKRVYINILSFCFIFLFSTQACGQENNTLSSEKENASSTQLVATVNAYNISHKKEAEGKFLVSFDIENRLMVQPEIKWGIILNKIENGKEIEVDRKNSSDFVSLSENQKVSVQIEYQAPYFSQGEHEIILEIRTAEGLLLDYAKVGKVELSGNNQRIEVEKDKCSFFNSSSNLETGFSEGMFYEEKNSIFIKCPIANELGYAMSAVPVISLESNSPYGEIMSESEYPATNLSSGEEKNIELKIPSFSDKNNQSVSLTFFFKKDGQAISPKIEASLFRQSKNKENARLINVRFNKSSYFSGETAEVVVDWDGFSIGQGGLNVPIREIPVEMELVSQNGISCVNSSKKIAKSITRDTDQYESKLNVGIERECKNFMLSIALLDSNGNKLSGGEYKIAPQNIQAKIFDTIKKGVVKYKKEIVIVFAIFNCLIIFWFTYKWIKRKIAYRNYIIPMVPIIFAIFLGWPGKSKADTFYDPGNKMIYNLSTDKESYFVNDDNDKKYTLKTSVQRYYLTGYSWNPEFRLSLQVKAPGIQTENPQFSGWITILENTLLSVDQVAGAEIEAETPRIQEYDSNSGPILRSVLNGKFVFNGEILAKLSLHLRENGECGKRDYVDDQAIKSEACLYGTHSFSDEQKKFEYADMDGRIKWKCLNIEGEKDANCDGLIKFDAQCGKANGKAICNLGKYSSSAQSIYSDYPLYCDNRGWVVGEQRSLETWGRVPENFSSDSNEKGKSWVCRGVGGGADVSCKIIPGKKAVCGPASSQPSKETPKEGLCASGSSSGMVRVQDIESGNNNKKNEKWKWTCDFSEMNISYGCAVDCTAPVLIEPLPEQVAEDAKPKDQTQ